MGDTKTWDTSRLTTLHRVHAVSVWATVVLELPASLAPSFRRLVRPAMPRDWEEWFGGGLRASMWAAYRLPGIQDGLGKVRGQGLCQLLCAPLCASEERPSMRLKHGESATKVELLRASETSGSEAQSSGVGITIRRNGGLCVGEQ